MRRFAVKYVMPVLAMVMVLMPKTATAQKTPEEKLSMTMYAIMSMYVDSVAKQQFVDEQIARMLQGLDPFSMYLPAQQAMEKEQTVLAQPASETESKDRYANTVQTGTVTAKQAFSSLRSYMLDRQTGFIQLMVFSAAAADEFRQAVASLKKQGMKNLILDIRNNHGGLTDAAVEVADELLEGEKNVFSATGAHVDTQVFKTSRQGCFETGRLVLLTNGETMSAAELFAGAIQDWDRGLVVGETSFGKGLIQETLPFEDGSAIQLTVARYQTPSGRSIQKPYSNKVDAAVTDSSFSSMISHRPLRANAGIAPDMVVNSFPPPYETMWYTVFLLTRSAAKAANMYLENHRAELAKSYKSQEAFVKDFDEKKLEPTVREVTNAMGKTFPDEEFKKSMARVLLETKAFLGRALFETDDCYYQVIASNTNPETEHHANLVLRKAWNLINNPAGYKQLLGQ